LTIKRLLEVEEDINLCETFGNSKEKEEIIKELNKNGFRGDIKGLCQLQAEITQIDKQLDKIREQARTIIEDLMELTKGQFFLKGRQQNLILFGDINVQGGHAFIGNQFGDNANLSHNNYTTGIEEITEQFQAQILQPTNPPHKN
ncbi:2546_t:CDS:1, partial [Entrophospora sp. SA101]